MLVASILVDERVIAMGRTIVIDHNSLLSAPQDVQQALTAHLNTASPGWSTVDVSRDFYAMPGEWKTVEGLGRVNQTHLLVSFSIDGASSKRYLKYVRMHCALCGAGEGVLLSWDGRKWQRETLLTTRM
jgi:hypothetical protein